MRGARQRQERFSVPSSAMTRWLRQGLELGICPMCRGVHKADREYAWHFSEEGMVNADAVAALAAARVLC